MIFFVLNIDKKVHKDISKDTELVIHPIKYQINEFDDK